MVTKNIDVIVDMTTPIILADQIQLAGLSVSGFCVNNRLERRLS